MENELLNTTNFLALQVLIECLAEELIELDVIKKENLDKRVESKIQLLVKINEELELMNSTTPINFFNGKMGEA